MIEKGPDIDLDIAIHDIYLKHIRKNRKWFWFIFKPIYGYPKIWLFGTILEIGDLTVNVYNRKDVEIAREITQELEELFGFELTLRHEYPANHL